MNRVVFCGLLLALGVAACSTVPSTGPLREQLLDQANASGGGRFEVVKVDQHVIDTLSARPQPRFHERFSNYSPPPELPIAVGDILSVSVWESSAEGLFGPSLKAQGPSTPDLIEKMKAGGITMPPGSTRDEVITRLKTTALGQSLLQQFEPAGRSGTLVPDQRVGADGAISIPYAGRIRVAGRSPPEVQHLIEQLLAGKALDPQALVIVKESDVNSVSVMGEAIKGARVPLGPGGARLLDVIAAAGDLRPPTPSPSPSPSPPQRPPTPPVTAINLPPLWGLPGTLGIPPVVPSKPVQHPSIATIHDTFVELSRDGVTASIPYATLVADPAEDIFARPGDILTLVRRPQVISVFGATGQNSAVVFDAPRVSLSEALAKSGGLLDNSADPQAVFLLRYEPRSVASAFGEPLAPATRDAVYPVAYRLDLSDAASYALAKQFPVRDKDIIYVADAASLPIQKVFTVIQTLTAPILSNFVSCGVPNC